MRRSLVIFFSIFFCVVFCLGLYPENVGAVSYYNHLKNPSFELSTNYFEDGGFESGLLEQGSIFGNWSSNDALAYSSAERRTGVYAACMVYSSGDDLWWNFTSGYYVLGAEFLECSGYMKVSDAYTDAEVVIVAYYTDDTYEQVGAKTLDETQWYYYDWSSGIDDAKFVKAFHFVWGLNHHPTYLDDMVCTVMDGEESGCQDEIAVGSVPWHFYDIAFATESWWTVSSEISTDEYNLGSSSYYVDWDTSSHILSPPIMQNIEPVDVENVLFADLWVLNDEVAGDTIWIDFTVHYADGSASYRNMTVDFSVNWQHINFGNSFFKSSGMVTEVYVMFGGWSGHGVYIDDVGLWCEVPLGFKSFDYSVSPAPLYGYNGFEVALRPNINYVFYGTVYNSSGLADGDGIGMVYSDEGWVDFNITGGIFQFPISSRSSVGHSYRWSESFVITLIIDGVDKSVCVWVTWIPLSESSTPAPSGGDVVTPEGDDFTMLVCYFVLFGLPPALLSLGGAKHGWGLQGLLFGALISLSAGILVGLIPFWLVFMVGVGMVMLIYSMQKRS